MSAPLMAHHRVSRLALERWIPPQQGEPAGRWSLLRLVSRFQRRTDQGQVAAIFIVLIGLALMFAAFTMNLGEVARLKTSTANAADAGALAGASWVASGENNLVSFAHGMWLNYWIIVTLFAFPWCWPAIFTYPILVAAALMAANGVLWYQSDQMMSGAYDNGKAAALFTVIQNAAIDDTSGDVAAHQIKPIADHIEGGGEAPSHVQLHWKRTGGDSVARESRLTIDTDFGAKPMLVLGPNVLVYWGWLPIFVCPYCCPPMVGWGGTIGSGLLQIPSIITTCKSCGAIEIGVIVMTVVTPMTIADAHGDVQVKVDHHRGGNAQIGLWRMRYPNQIHSDSTARFQCDETSVLWPTPFDADGQAFLKSVH